MEPLAAWSLTSVLKCPYFWEVLAAIASRAKRVLLLKGKNMKKVVGIVVLCASLALAPVAASAHTRHHHAHDAELLVAVGGGAAAGAVIAGPVGAVVGGVIGLVIIHHHHF